VKPFSQAPASALRRVVGLCTDLDGTLTDADGRLSARAYAALWRAKEAGLHVVVATGRPAGWCDAFARLFPVDAVVGEGGGFYFAIRDGQLHKRYAIRSDARRAALRARLLDAGRRARVRWSSDNAYRETDVAADWNEERRLTPAARDRVVAAFASRGADASYSSVHVNAHYNRADKLTLLRAFSREMLGAELSRARWVYVGDAPNDEPMFRYFTLSVGVANVREHLARLRQPPAYVTRAPGGAGFAQVVARLSRLHSA
jgi:hypothetical protein